MRGPLRPRWERAGRAGHARTGRGELHPGCALVEAGCTRAMPGLAEASCTRAALGIRRAAPACTGLINSSHAVIPPGTTASLWGSRSRVPDHENVTIGGNTCLLLV